MAETNVNSPAPKKRRGWLKWLLSVVVVLLLLVVVAFFVVTSSAFFKGVILPKAGKAMNADITVSDASISPFSQVILHDLKVQTTGSEPLVRAREVRLHYSLMDIIRGNIHVDEVGLDSPIVTLVQNPDGTSNLDPILKSQKQQPQKPSQPSKPSKPAQVDVKKIDFNDVTLRHIKLYQGSGSDRAEISHFNLTIDNVKNGQAGKVTVSAELAMNNNPPAPASAGMLAGKLNGSYDFSLSPDLKPTSVKGNTHFEVTKAEGALSQAAAFNSDLDCDLNATEIKQVALHFQQGSTPLGQLRVSGPLDIEKVQGKLLVELSGIDKKLLNLAGAASGLDFGPTTINSSNEVQLASATSLTINGQFNINKMQVTRTNQTTPPLDLRADYGVAVDTTKSNLTLNSFTVNGAQKGRTIIDGRLTSPMQISWGNPENAVGDSTLNLVVTNFDLADWSAFAGDAAPEGILNASLNLLSQQAGKQLTFEVASKLDNLGAGAGSNRISQLSINFNLNGKAANLQKYELSSYKLDVAHQSQPMLNASGSGTFDKATQAADMQFEGRVMLPATLEALHNSSLKLSSGEATMKGHLTQQGSQQAVSTIKATLGVTNLVAKGGNAPTNALDAGVQLDASLNGKVADLRQCQLSLTPTSRATNQLNLTGHVDMSQSNAITGTVTLAGDALDLSSYYDLFTSQPKTATASTSATAANKPAPTAQPSSPETEPPAVHFPVRNFAAEAKLKHLYLHELDVADIQASTKIDDSHIVLNPAKLTLNGAPVSATLDADLGVPGYKYNFTMNGQAVPLAPIVNSFLPDRKGILSGTVTAQANANGAGITGASLQKSLTAQFDVGSTNLNLSIDSIQGKNVSTRLLKALLDTISSIPDIVKGQSGLGSIASAALGNTSGATSSLKKSPINSIIFRGNAGSGQINLQQASIESPAFQTGIAGPITLAPVLTNSTIQLAISVWLERSVAETIQLAGDTPTNATYAKLPDFISYVGTLGAAKPKYNWTVVLSAIAKAAGGKNIPGLSGILGGGSNTNGVAGNAGNLLRGVLGGGLSTNTAATNQANNSGNLIRGLGGLLGGGANQTTNSPATNKPSLRDLFK